jgi:hypothetical protein
MFLGLPIRIPFTKISLLNVFDGPVNTFVPAKVVYNPILKFVIAFVTKLVVAICVVAVAATAVGAAGVPVKVGDALRA